MSKENELNNGGQPANPAPDAGAQPQPDATIGNPEGGAAQPNPSEPKPNEGGDKSGEGSPKTNEDNSTIRSIRKAAANAQKLADRLKAENEALRATIQGGQPRERAPEEPKPPIRTDFEDVDDYIAAKTDWEINKRLPQKQAEIEARNVQTSFRQKEAEFKKTVDDYEDTIAMAGNMPISNIAAQAILSSDMGPALRYYLAQNPDEVEKVNSMSPAAAARHIGRIEAKLELEAKEKTKSTVKKPSNAPDPLKPVKPSDTPVETDIFKLPMADYIKQANEEDRKRGRPI
jgi:hypothetical protein